MNNMVDYSDLFGKFHDYIEKWHMDPLKLKKEKVYSIKEDKRTLTSKKLTFFYFNIS